MKICVSRLLVFTLILLSPLVAFAGPRYGILYSFPCSPVFSCPDGLDPSAGVIRDASGNLYGTTSFGGANLGSSTTEQVRCSTWRLRRSRAAPGQRPCSIASAPLRSARTGRILKLG
jgi:hypothetical protein